MTPLLLLALGSALAGLVGVLGLPPASLARGALDVLPMAAPATLICLALAAPAMATAPGSIWLAAAWLGLGPGLAAWSLIAAPPLGLGLAAETALMLLPVAIFCLADPRDHAAARLGRAAASSGAGRLATLLHAVLRPAWTRVLNTALLVGVLATGLLAAYRG